MQKLTTRELLLLADAAFKQEPADWQIVHALLLLVVELRQVNDQLDHIVRNTVPP